MEICFKLYRMKEVIRRNIVTAVIRVRQKGLGIVWVETEVTMRMHCILAMELVVVVVVVEVVEEEEEEKEEVEEEEIGRAHV